MAEAWNAIAADIAGALAEVRDVAQAEAIGAILRSEVDKNGRPHDPDSWTVTEVAHPAEMVRLEYDDRDIDGTLILTTDHQFLVEASGLSIEIGTSDRLRFGSSIYEIGNVKPLAPAGVTVMFEVQGRA